jgi:broad specificity phosphatase PhoE
LSLLILVRHGQASLMADDYDQLSDLGAEQGRALGLYWAERGVVPDEVFVGPRLRHRQTYEAVAAGLADGGVGLPEPSYLQELDEHHGHAVMESVIPRLRSGDEGIRWLLEGSGEEGLTDRRGYLRVFQRVLGAWARGELAVEGHEEPWDRFRARVALGLDRLTHSESGGRTVLAFTSGGFISAAVGQVLDLNGSKVMELSWNIRNGSYTEVLFSGGRRSLRGFNVIPPVEARLHTYV